MREREREEVEMKGLSGDGPYLLFDPILSAIKANAAKIKASLSIAIEWNVFADFKDERVIVA